MVQAKKSTAKPVKISAAKPKTAAAPKKPAAVAAIDSSVNTAKQIAATSAENSKQAQEKVLSIGRDAVENLTRSTDQANRSLNEAFALNKEHMDAVITSSKIAGDVGSELQEKLVKDLNDVFAENVELSKELLSCRTLNDLVSLQNRALQSNLSRFFDNSARLTDAWFKLSTDAAEPLNAQAAQISSQLNKTFTR